MDNINIKKIKELVKILSQSDLSALEISTDEGKIKLERKSDKAKTQSQPTQNQQLEQVVASGETIKVESLPKPTHSVVDFNNLKEVKSPMIGVFYKAPAPNAQPFVKVGDKIKNGDVLCIIEAMKMMNEITAEVDGEIVDICVENGEVVEYGQVLFKIY